MLAPSTRIENERLGELSGEVKEKGNKTGQEALERGKQVAQETAQAAGEAANAVKETEQQLPASDC